MTDDTLTVTTLRSTPEPERLVAQCARGDYWDGFVGETDFDYLMKSVEHTGRHISIAKQLDLDDTETNYRLVGLLERLFRRGHWGPFEHPQITIAVKGATRSCMAQITRHRHATFDVQSQRYVDFSEKDDPVTVPKSLVDPDHFARETGEVDVDDDDRASLQETFEDHYESAIGLYEDAVGNGIPKEDARFALPIGTQVNWTMSMNARALLHVANMRGRANVQWEARELTEKVLNEFGAWMPITAHLWDEHGPIQLGP